MQKLLWIPLAMLMALVVACTATAEVPPGMAKATFAVHCYTVGVSALAGKPGVISVDPGWSGAREVDRVVFDPREVSVAQLENWLKDADTYISTLETSVNKEFEKEMSQ